MHDRLDSIDDMMRFVENYPEFRKTGHNVTKHVTLLSELSRLVDKQQLLEVSQLEQDLACRESEAEHQEQVLRALKSFRITRHDKLKLVLLFALRYERGAERILGALLQGLYEAGLGSDQVALVKGLIKLAGSSVRHGDVLNNRSFLAMARSSVRRGFGGVANVYTQHEPLLAATLDEALRGRLRTAEYPFIHADVPSASREWIVFVAGGITCEEAKCVAEINRTAAASSADKTFVHSARAAAAANNGFVVLGGSTLHNSRSFLAEVARVT
eukprot:Plantae.Rhodophyta-Purpureofilum_apyrenoidigerum.ctg45647.p1 GENE.Plantae.Rhodophyta-Purpureofilum_apyrenoidigerum.ctg45647~~Plantae.Rhodophyta-Purpureofilum_apyrenoidigerum.ctg45647.p1  ORF type:complete len:271 (+),score=48.19 Plantae.Rhodophyta-Purpureofilum_apyrenoidigerum.ctg45647:122-934(+)